KDDAAWRLPAQELEKVVLAFLVELLRDGARLAKVIGHGDAAVLRRALERSAELVAGGHEALAQRDLVASILPKIIVAPQRLSLTISNQSLRNVLGVPAHDPAEPLDTVVDQSFTLRRRRVETKLVLAGERQMPSV